MSKSVDYIMDSKNKYSADKCDRTAYREKIMIDPNYKKTILERQNATIVDFLSYIGGVMNIYLYVSGLLGHYLSKVSLDAKLIRSVFFFEQDTKDKSIRQTVRNLLNTYEFKMRSKKSGVKLWLKIGRLSLRSNPLCFSVRTNKSK